MKWSVVLWSAVRVLGIVAQAASLTYLIRMCDGKSLQYTILSATVVVLAVNAMSWWMRFRMKTLMTKGSGSSAA